MYFFLAATLKDVFPLLSDTFQSGRNLEVEITAEIYSNTCQATRRTPGGKEVTGCPLSTQWVTEPGTGYAPDFHHWNTRRLNELPRGNLIRCLLVACSRIPSHIWQMFTERLLCASWVFHMATWYQRKRSSGTSTPAALGSEVIRWLQQSSRVNVRCQNGAQHLPKSGMASACREALRGGDGGGVWLEACLNT